MAEPIVIELPDVGEAPEEEEGGEGIVIELPEPVEPESGPGTMEPIFLTVPPGVLPDGDSDGGKGGDGRSRRRRLAPEIRTFLDYITNYRVPTSYPSYSQPTRLGFSSFLDYPTGYPPRYRPNLRGLFDFITRR